MTLWAALPHGIPFCQILFAIEQCRESACGTFQTNQEPVSSVCSTRESSRKFLAAALPFVNISLEFGREILSFWSGIDPVGPVLGEHLEDDPADMSAEGADGLVMFFALSAFGLVVAL